MAGFATCLVFFLAAQATGRAAGINLHTSVTAWTTYCAGPGEGPFQGELALTAQKFCSLERVIRHLVSFQWPV